MLCFFRQFYEMLTSNMIIEWAALNNLKLKTSTLSLDYYMAISERIKRIIESFNQRRNCYSFFSFSDVESDSRDYCVIVDNHFYLNIFEFEVRDYGLIGPTSSVIHAHIGLESFNFVDSSSWIKFVYNQFGERFLRCYMFSKLKYYHVEKYVEESRVIVDETVHVKELIMSENYKVYFILDSQGYEYRIEINNMMECFIHRSKIKYQEYGHHVPYVPQYFDIRGEFTLYEFFKNNLMSRGGDCA